MPSPEAILDVAERIHRKHGLPALSLRRLAKAVGVTPMALYRHFEDKDALLNALAERGFARLETFLAKAAAKRDPLARVRAGIVQYREFALAQRRLFELMFLVPRRGVPGAPGSLRETSSPSFAKLIEALKECMERGTLPRADPAQLILLVWGTAHGLIGLHYSGRFGSDIRFRTVFDTMLHLQFHLLRGEAERAAKRRAQ
jgi:AcrR family transcriptional regulator